VCPAVDLEDAIVEVLDPEAQPRHAHAPDGGELGVRECPWLALERDFLGAGPGRDRRQSPHQTLQLLRREKRRRAAAEVHEVQRPSGDRRQLAVQLPFATEYVEVVADLLRVLVCIDPEIAEVAALPAEGNVQVEAERNARDRRRLQRRPRIPRHGFLRPHRKRWVGGDEIAADVGLVRDRRFQGSRVLRSYGYERSTVMNGQR
jgi:hypothetical protein